MSTGDHSREVFLGWHFLRENRRLGYEDTRLVTVGETLSVEGRLVLCQSGLHASARPIDALKYAPGPIVCRVELSGSILYGDDKACASHRRVLWMGDATKALRHFACDVAFETLTNERKQGREPDQRSWNAIVVARKWIEGEATEEERSAAQSAAESAAESAARSAARSAAESAAESAAWSAAESAFSAARSAAFSAARSAAWSAARSAARSAAESAADKRLEALFRKLELGEPLYDPASSHSSF